MRLAPDGSTTTLSVSDDGGGSSGPDRARPLRAAPDERHRARGRRVAVRALPARPGHAGRTRPPPRLTRAADLPGLPGSRARTADVADTTSFPRSAPTVIPTTPFTRQVRHGFHHEGDADDAGPGRARAPGASAGTDGPRIAEQPPDQAGADPGGRICRLVAAVLGLPTTAVTAQAARGARRSGLHGHAGDLAFILKQIKIAERHVANTTSATGPAARSSARARTRFPTPSRPTACARSTARATTCSPGREKFGAADQLFPRLTTPDFRTPEPSPPASARPGRRRTSRSPATCSTPSRASSAT